jgi:hypothetical protein
LYLSYGVQVNVNAVPLGKPDGVGESANHQLALILPGVVGVYITVTVNVPIPVAATVAPTGTELTQAS